MKVKFLATGDGPDSYSFSGDIVTVAKSGQSENFDFSLLECGGEVSNIDVDVLPLISEQVIRSVERDTDGELRLTLCQVAPAGHWRESGWMDASAYVADETYIVEVANG